MDRRHLFGLAALPMMGNPLSRPTEHVFPVMNDTRRANYLNSRAHVAPHLRVDIEALLSLNNKVAERIGDPGVWLPYEITASRTLFKEQWPFYDRPQTAEDYDQLDHMAASMMTEIKNLGRRFVGRFVAVMPVGAVIDPTTFEPVLRYALHHIRLPR